MANRITRPALTPFDHDHWRSEVLSYYPEAFMQDDSTTSGLRERALCKGQLVGFFLRSHGTGQGCGYVKPWSDDVG
jgi:hypothetical protein